MPLRCLPLARAAEWGLGLCLCRWQLRGRTLWRCWLLPLALLLPLMLLLRLLLLLGRVSLLTHHRFPYQLLLPRLLPRLRQGRCTLHALLPTSLLGYLGLLLLLLPPLEAQRLLQLGEHLLLVLLLLSAGWHMQDHAHQHALQGRILLHAAGTCAVGRSMTARPGSCCRACSGWCGCGCGCCGCACCRCCCCCCCCQWRSSQRAARAASCCIGTWRQPQRAHREAQQRHITCGQR